MPSAAFDTIIAAALASGQSAAYETTPEDFSPAANRWLLRQSLAALGERYKGIQIRLFGAPPVLLKFGLEAGEILIAGALHVPVAQGKTQKSGALRFVVMPAA